MPPRGAKNGPKAAAVDTVFLRRHQARSPVLAKRRPGSHLNPNWGRYPYGAPAKGAMSIAQVPGVASKPVNDIIPLPTGHGRETRVKNGPALAGHGAEAVRDAITRSIITLPEELRRSLTWDQGAEMAQHARLKIDAGIQVYFCDPHSPWQRGTNENINGLLRQYFPKGTDLSMHSADDIAAVAAALNTRPRKTLAWQTPAEALDQLLISAMSSDVRN